jgi:DNA-binding NarL/FixJ family response regulator
MTDHTGEPDTLKQTATAFRGAQRALELTTRQREVLVLLAKGHTAKEIGAELGISARTARAHLDVLRQKIGATRVRELPARYRELTGLDILGVA